MSEAANDVQNAYLTRRAEFDLQQDFAFELQRACVIRVRWCRLEQYFDRRIDSWCRRRFRSGLLRRRLGVEPARADAAAPGLGRFRTTGAGRGAKPGVGDGAR